MSELDDILAEDEKETQSPAEGDKKPDEKNEEALKKEEQLNNLNKAISEAQDELKKIRTAKKKEKQGSNEQEEEDELPKIDMSDPSAKAWDKHISDSVNPYKAEVEKGKDERRQFALNEFLADKPNLAKNPEKIKELIATYEKIRTASELTTEGITLDLKKAYAATFHEELVDIARGERVGKAKADAIFSDIAVSRGATSYTVQKEKSPQLDQESLRILAKWGMTPEEWAEDYKKYKA